jgi:hypothetical protein
MVFYFMSYSTSVTGKNAKEKRKLKKEKFRVIVDLLTRPSVETINSIKYKQLKNANK